MTRKDVVKIILLVLLLSAAYIPSFIWMFERWTAPGTYYTHGFLIPLLCLCIAFQKRRELKAAVLRPSKPGWLFFVIAVLLYALSALWQVYFSGAVSLIIMIASLILLFFGRDVARILSFAVGFLIFMVPIPLIMIARLSFKLKVIASEIAVQMVRAAGIDAVREGGLILTSRTYLVVDEPCSGMRSLIALIALAALVQYYTRVGLIRRSVILLSAIPVAVISNALRIFVLTIVAQLYGAHVIEGLVHDASGLLVFAAAFVALFVIAKLLE
ncbi:MAG: exosortase/archaeosortase family protein [Candidatus Omnitrophica bacterium]|nr:exosortase/archaeosortase family protein [Candidatus Omnitrophota bacterium]